MKFVEKIKYNLNLTQNEIKILFFLVFTFLIGVTIKFIKSNSQDSNLSLDYSKSDSIFFSLSNTETSLNATPSDKQVEKPKNLSLKEKSININKATKSDLVKLPGIGEVLAGNIIKYREENGKFDSIDELLKVKGIGKKKLEKIKQYIYIE